MAGYLGNGLDWSFVKVATVFQAFKVKPPEASKPPPPLVPVPIAYGTAAPGVPLRSLPPPLKIRAASAPTTGTPHVVPIANPPRGPLPPTPTANGPQPMCLVVLLHSRFYLQLVVV